MNIIRIDDGRDPRLADYAGVREPRLLRERGLLIAEGRFVVRRLFDSRRIRVRSLLVNDAALNGLSDVLTVNAGVPDEASTDAAAVAARIDVFVASPDVI